MYIFCGCGQGGRGIFWFAIYIFPMEVSKGGRGIFLYGVFMYIILNGWKGTDGIYVHVIFYWL